MASRWPSCPTHVPRELVSSVQGDPKPTHAPSPQLLFSGSPSYFKKDPQSLPCLAGPSASPRSSLTRRLVPAVPPPAPPAAIALRLPQAYGRRGSLCPESWPSDLGPAFLWSHSVLISHLTCQSRSLGPAKGPRAPSPPMTRAALLRTLRTGVSCSHVCACRWPESPSPTDLPTGQGLGWGARAVSRAGTVGTLLGHEQRPPAARSAARESHQRVAFVRPCPLLPPDARCARVGSH